MGQVLQDIAQQQAARIIELEAALAAANQPRKLTLKQGAKGGLSVYGLGRFPVTLYAGQWHQLLAPVQVKAILDFIKAKDMPLTKG